METLGQKQKRSMKRICSVWLLLFTGACEQPPTAEPEQPSEFQIKSTASEQACIDRGGVPIYQPNWGGALFIRCDFPCNGTRVNGEAPAQ